MRVKLDYKIGEKIIISDYVMIVIGFEYLEGRGMRYILLTVNGNATEWRYLYTFEIKALKKHG